MRVLMTGHRGYVGSVMATVLRNLRFEVVGLDSDLYRGCDFGRVRDTDESYCVDLRDIEFTDLLSFDAVVHLASLPEDAPAELNLSLIREINEEATVHLAECCKRAGVSRFLYASSASVYGGDDGRPIGEDRPLHPTTPDGVSKLRCESVLARLADASFTTVFLRHAEVYGVSPRLRTDPIVNQFVASAMTTGRVNVPGRGHGWRSVVHVEDLARTYAAMLMAPEEIVHNQAFNVAATSENHRVIEIADAVTELVPECTKRLSPNLFSDPGCRLDGSKLMLAVPKLSFRWTMQDGIRQLRNALRSCGLTPADLRSDRFQRSSRLRTLIERNELDATLRLPASVLA
jgi:nucleoside-diphosphate-sugar epimerase